MTKLTTQDLIWASIAMDFYLENGEVPSKSDTFKDSKIRIDELMIETAVKTGK